MIEVLDAPGWNWEILSLSDKKHSKGNIKSVIRWENIPNHVLEHIGRHLPVYKVQLIG